MGLSVARDEIPLFKIDPVDNIGRKYAWEFERVVDRGFRRLDSVRLTEPEAEKLCGILQKNQQAGSELLERPALPEFELVVTAPIPSLRRTTVWFKKSVLPAVPFVKEGEDVCLTKFIPCIDAYVSFNSQRELDTYMTLFAVRVYDGSGKCVDDTSTSLLAHGFRPESGIAYGNGFIDHNVSEVLSYIRLLYLAVQKAMYDKPAVFVESATSRLPSGGGNTVSAKNGKNKVRAVKVVRINSGELASYTKGKKTMHCPCWGVVGHFRTLKTGREIWIKPYRKGKERNNPAAYVPKEYQMEG